MKLTKEFSQDIKGEVFTERTGQLVGSKKKTFRGGVGKSCGNYAQTFPCRHLKGHKEIVPEGGDKQSTQSYIGAIA